VPTPQDLIHVISTTTGTGDMTVSAVIRNFSDSDAFGTGTTTDVFDYFGWNDDVAGEWERGTGHMSAAGTLVRDTVKASSNAGAAVDWSAGTKHFANDVPAAKQVTTDAIGTVAALDVDTDGTLAADDDTKIASQKAVKSYVDNHGGSPSQPQGRLTLTTGVAVTTNDVAGATTIYYTPTVGTGVPLYDGSVTKMADIGGELSLALDATSGDTGYHQSGKIFDLFVFDDAGTMRLGTGPAWSSDTSRGTGAGTTELELKNGFFTNKQSITARFGSSSGNTVSVAANQALYVGSFRASANGQASDTKAKRLLFNTYNQVLRPLYVTDAANNWQYTTNAFRQVHASTANQIDILVGLPGTMVSLTAHNIVLSTTTTLRNVWGGIGLDSTTANSGRSVYCAATSLQISLCLSFFEDAIPLGRHYLAWLECGSGSDTQSWFGTNSGTITAGPGMFGKICI
jgi:hypothetical protein